ncbi:HEPN domain-containing protein [Paraburkholderia caribensis]|uniref:HEPN domain-containing protein n=1 Tax=Paraburkholderia caribensis TaxID=75105 RepID=UPI0034D1B0FF
MKNDAVSNVTRHVKVRLLIPDADEAGMCTLTFGGGEWTCLRFGDRAPGSVAGIAKLDMLKCISEAGDIYSLCHCDLTGNAAYADYVVEGDPASSKFDRISVRYADVSEWYLRSQTITGTVGMELVWRQIPEQVSVIVDSKDEVFSVESAYVSSRRIQGEELVLHEHIQFIFTAEVPAWEPAEVRTKVHRLSCLLSILMGYPATTLSVSVGQQGGSSMRLHYPTSDRPARDVGDPGFVPKLLVQQHQLAGRWKAVLDAYFTSKYREVCWVRLAGMQRYEGFWEYRTLGYVSLLDSYLTIRFEKVKSSAPVPPAQKKLAAFRQAIVEEFSELAQSQIERILELAQQSFSSKEPDFGEKYRMAMAETDAGVRQIIGLSDDDFKYIKKIRDRIAHGKDHGLKDGNYTPVSRAVAKIILLLTYWALRDFGLETADFIESLASTRSSLRAEANVDEVHLSRLSGRASFFQISRQKLDALRSTRGIRVDACFVEDASGQIDYSADLTRSFREWRHNDGKGRSGPISASLALGLDPADTRFVNECYLEAGDDRLELFNMWLISHSAISRPEAESRVG